MPKIAIRTLGDAGPSGSASGSGIETRAYFEENRAPIHLHRHRMCEGAHLTVRGESSDCLIYVLDGSANADGSVLRARSSAIVEMGGQLGVQACAGGSTLLVFSATRRAEGRESRGLVHLLPTEAVPRTAAFFDTEGVAAGIHADAQCPSCCVWLHEQGYSEGDKNTPVHSHSEDEIIYVIGGSIRLGNRLYGPGTALFVAANAKYGFNTGPDGLEFINFRGSSPSFTSGDGATVLDEAKLWRSGLAAPSYISRLGSP